jgi:hypothetical protein
MRDSHFFSFFCSFFFSFFVFQFTGEGGSIPFMGMLGEMFRRLNSSIIELAIAAIRGVVHRSRDCAGPVQGQHARDRRCRCSTDPRVHSSRKKKHF